jgi:hypothetical protein
MYRAARTPPQPVRGEPGAPCRYGATVPLAALEARLGEARALPATLATGAVCAGALVALVDPEGGAYPTCPTRALLGVDCPACGTLRGLHALARGRVSEALDHNLLLLLAVPLGVVAWFGWVRAAAGAPMATRAVPRWAIALAVVVAIAFAVLRNLSLGGLEWLDSGA